MIMMENITINGRPFVRTYSSLGLRITQVETGIIYEEAIDIHGAPYTYTEIGDDVELTAEEALAVILGGDKNV